MFYFNDICNDVIAEGYAPSSSDYSVKNFALHIYGRDPVRKTRLMRGNYTFIESRQADGDELDWALRILGRPPATTPAHWFVGEAAREIWVNLYSSTKDGNHRETTKRT